MSVSFLFVDFSRGYFVFTFGNHNDEVRSTTLTNDDGLLTVKLIILLTARATMAPIQS